MPLFNHNIALGCGDTRYPQSRVPRRGLVLSLLRLIAASIFYHKFLRTHGFCFWKLRRNFQRSECDGGILENPPTTASSTLHPHDGTHFHGFNSVNKMQLKSLPSSNTHRAFVLFIHLLGIGFQRGPVAIINVKACCSSLSSSCGSSY